MDGFLEVVGFGFGFGNHKTCYSFQMSVEYSRKRALIWNLDPYLDVEKLNYLFPKFCENLS